MDGYFFVSANRKGSYSVSSFRCNRGLASELLQYLGRSCEAIARFADGNVDDKLVDFELLHGVLRSGFGLGHLGVGLGK